MYGLSELLSELTVIDHGLAVASAHVTRVQVQGTRGTIHFINGDRVDLDFDTTGSVRDALAARAGGHVPRLPCRDLPVGDQRLGA